MLAYGTYRRTEMGHHTEFYAFVGYVALFVYIISIPMYIVASFLDAKRRGWYTQGDFVSDVFAFTIPVINTLYCLDILSRLSGKWSTKILWERK
jgi:hypothetical protein